MGGHSHSYDFEVVTPALQYILEEYGSRVILRFWGLQPPQTLRDFPSVEGLNPQLVDYQEFAAYFMQQNCDIGSRPCRIIYSTLHKPPEIPRIRRPGRPAVYSKVTPYEQLVVTANGVLASCKEEWSATLSRS